MSVKKSVLEWLFRTYMAGFTLFFLTIIVGDYVPLAIAIIVPFMVIYVAIPLLSAINIAERYYLLSKENFKKTIGILMVSSVVAIYVVVNPGLNLIYRFYEYDITFLLYVFGPLYHIPVSLLEALGFKLLIKKDESKAKRKPGNRT